MMLKFVFDDDRLVYHDDIIMISHIVLIFIMVYNAILFNNYLSSNVYDVSHLISLISLA